jgi:hypothetical protein
MGNINQHIEQDKKLLDDGTLSPQMRRHVEGELEQLQLYKKNHPNDDHDPTVLELFCDLNPDAPECKIYED